MMKLVLCVSLLFASPFVVDVTARAVTGEEHQLVGHDQDSTAANPIRKVVSLLQKMAKTVEKEAAQERDLFDKFICWCQTGGSELQLAISDNTAKVPALQSDIEEAQSELVRLKEDLKQHQTDRAAANEAIAQATSLREKEQGAYAKESAELKGYITAMKGAIPAIESGMAGTRLLQAGASVKMLQRAVASADGVTDDDRQSILAFLSGSASESEGYVPKGGEVVGILKDMLENYEKDLASVEAAEADAVKTHEKLIAAKTKQVQVLGSAIETKTARVGELGISIVSMKNQLTDAEASLIEDQQFLQKMTKDCDSKKQEQEERIKSRAGEMQAIHETIKILNDDDALELFKRTLPSPSSSFVQLRVTVTDKTRNSALAILRRGDHSPTVQGHSGVRFLELALQGKKVDFTKVVKMIDDMIKILAEEQTDDDSKQEYCNRQIDSVEDKGKVLARKVEDLESSIEERKETIAQLKEDIKTLKNGVAELDKSVMEATEQRKEENQEFSELMSSDSAAKELLAFAKNRLNKFYSPKLYKAPPKRELSDQEKISSSMGDDIEAPASFVQLASLDAPTPPPSTWEGGYQSKSESSTGVIAMIDLLIRDLDKEMTIAQTQEEESQKDYEGLMNDSAEKRAKDLKAIATKDSSKADTEELLVKEQGDAQSSAQELQATKMYEQQLHAECDWLLQNFDLRRTARAQERDNLKEAKAVLSGADFSLLQASGPSLLSRRRSF